ncbi:sigma-70 family RNA polymerase sigma factor [Sphingomicrobium astaxanthinifaciens]|uniref:sigma-70 family RNA polymerase sigma factor n=1 Tax=Sphingomicrobium astaxanthinifaciens TaxID=1227949 RepID=UPI001FCC4046|nr:sigma-70 family RNA polymerase sigma factor [Sphingomicrobium astaxanthinifaciens]MCJ7420390.1 sigma-70 family RNA polymerase sigma factor [Sphingomicrobium astaxanthinifaciens]
MTFSYTRFAAARAYQDDAGEKVARYLPLVRKYAWQFSSSASSSFDMDDLMQAGLVALTECVQRHSNDSEDGFAAYVKMRVRGAMVDLMRASSTISRTTRSRSKALYEHQDRLRQELGREPTSPELSKSLGISLDELFELRANLAAGQVDPIDENYCDTDLQFQSDIADPESEVLAGDAKEALTEAITGLPERLQLVVQLYFVEEMNLNEIAEILEVSVPRVHQLKAKALKTLRERFD